MFRYLLYAHILQRRKAKTHGKTVYVVYGSGNVCQKLADWMFIVSIPSSW